MNNKMIGLIVGAIIIIGGGLTLWIMNQEEALPGMEEAPLISESDTLEARCMKRATRIQELYKGIEALESQIEQAVENFDRDKDSNIQDKQEDCDEIQEEYRNEVASGKKDDTTKDFNDLLDEIVEDHLACLDSLKKLQSGTSPEVENLQKQLQQLKDEQFQLQADNVVDNCPAVK